MRAGRNGQRGFTLMEAIVALVLVGSVGLAVFDWINGSLLALRQVNDVNDESEATVNVLEFMNGVNPMTAPRGEASFGSYRIRWTVQPLTPTVDRAESYYQFALYRTRVEVQKGPGQRWFEIDLQQVGHKQVRSGGREG